MKTLGALAGRVIGVSTWIGIPTPRARRFLVSGALAISWLSSSPMLLADSSGSDTASVDLSGEAKPWDIGISKKVRRKANALFARGNERFTSDRHAEALKLYRKVLKLWKHPRVHLNAAASCIELDRLLNAAEHIDAIRKHRRHLGAKDRRKYEAMREVVEANTSVVVVKSEQKGAVITIDGDPVMIGPGTGRKRVLPGKHALVTRREGLESESQELDVAAGERVEVTPVLFVVASEWRWSKWKPWALVGVGAAVAASGAPLLLNARSLRQERSDFENEFCTDILTADCGPESDNQKKILGLDRSAERRTILANSAFVAGGVLAATGLVLAVLNRPTQVKRIANDDEIQANVWLGKEIVGAQLSMRF